MSVTNKLDIQQHVNLSSLNTLSLPGRAEFFCRVTNNDMLAEALDFARVQKLPLTILGGGSNVVLRGNLSGLLLQMATQGIHCERQNADRILWTAAAGENWHEFVMHTLAQKSGGLENLSLIPGLVGAAPLQNIGAYGLELSERFVRLTAIDIHSGEEVSFSQSDCQFAYRDSIFKQSAKGRYVITAVTVGLSEQMQVDIRYPALTKALSSKGDLSTLTPQDVSDAVCRVRQQKLPDPALIPNTGSFFKNPIISKVHWQRLHQQFQNLPAYPQPDGTVKLPAAWLIERAGWKGAKRAHCAVHGEHALVLVNTGGCSGGELLALADEISLDVKQKFDIVLEIEPQQLGVFT